MTLKGLRSVLEVGALTNGALRPEERPARIPIQAAAQSTRTLSAPVVAPTRSLSNDPMSYQGSLGEWSQLLTHQPSITWFEPDDDSDIRSNSSDEPSSEDEFSDKICSTQHIRQLMSYSGLTAPTVRDHIRTWIRLRHIYLNQQGEQPQRVRTMWRAYVDQALSLSTTKARSRLATTIGAVKRADLYSSQPVCSAGWESCMSSLKVPQFLRDTLRTLDYRHALGRRHDLPGLSPPQVATIIASLSTDWQARLYLTILYLTAARSTQLAAVRPSDVYVDQHTFAVDMTRTTPVTIRFRESKTGKVIAAYAITVALPSGEAENLKKLLGTKKDEHRVFTRRDAKIVSMTLRSNGSEVRAVRRGALRFLALQGVPPADLLLLSRHTSVAALYQYLGGGTYLRSEAATQWQMTSSIASMMLPPLPISGAPLSKGSRQE